MNIPQLLGLFGNGQLVWFLVGISLASVAVATRGNANLLIDWRGGRKVPVRGRPSLAYSIKALWSSPDRKPFWRFVWRIVAAAFWVILAVHLALNHRVWGLERGPVRLYVVSAGISAYTLAYWLANRTSMIVAYWRSYKRVMHPVMAYARAVLSHRWDLREIAMIDQKYQIPLRKRLQERDTRRMVVCFSSIIITVILSLVGV